MLAKKKDTAVAVCRNGHLKSHSGKAKFLEVYLKQIQCKHMQVIPTRSLSVENGNFHSFHERKKTLNFQVGS